MHEAAAAVGRRDWRMPSHTGERLVPVAEGDLVYCVAGGRFLQATVQALPEKASSRTVEVVTLATGERLRFAPGDLFPANEGDSAAHLERLLQHSGRIPEVPAMGAAGVVRVWRCQLWTEGLFSLLFWALGYLESQLESQLAGGLPGEEVPALLLIDMTDPRLRYRGPPGCPNIWTAFFDQPLAPRDSRRTAQRASQGFPSGSSGAMPEVSLEEAVSSAAAAGRLEVSTVFGEPHFDKLGSFRGSDEDTGRLDEDTARHGQDVIKRWIRIQPAIQAKVDRFCEERMSQEGLRWLAVHVRRTDKLLQSSGNRHADDSLCRDVVAVAKRDGFGGVVLCTDDATLKPWLETELATRHGLAVASYSAVLSSTGLPCHKDAALDPYRTAEDVLVEMLIMSQHCDAIISTWSNVSTAVVFFARQEGFAWHMFGDGFG